MKLIPKVREPVFVVQMHDSLTASKGDLILVFDKDGTDYEHLTQEQVRAMYRVARSDERTRKSTRSTARPLVVRKQRRPHAALKGESPTMSFNLGGGVDVSVRVVCTLAALQEQQRRLGRALNAPELSIAIHDEYPQWKPSIANVSSILSGAFTKKLVTRTKNVEHPRLFDYRISPHGQNVVTRFLTRANEFMRQHLTQKD